MKKPCSGDKDLGILVAPDDLVDTLLAVIRVHNRLREQANRLRFRAKYLWDKYTKSEILDELAKELPEGVPLRLTSQPRPKLSAHIQQGHPQAGVFPQKQPGLHYIGVAIPVGQLNANQLRTLASLADEFGNGTVRLTVWQNLLLPFIQTEDLETVKARLVQAGLHWKQSNLKSGIIACTGNRHCPYAQSDGKGHAVELGDFLDQHLDLDQPINIHFTACPFSCAQHYVGDIGLLAAKTGIGKEAAYHVFQGGGFGRKRSTGRKVSESPIPFQQLKTFILNMLRDWLDLRQPGESFQNYSLRTF